MYKQNLDSYRRLAKRKLAREPQELEAVLRDIEFLERGADKQTVESLRGLAGRSLAHSPDQLEDALRNVEVLERGPAVEGLLRLAPMVERAVAGPSWRERLSTCLALSLLFGVNLAIGLVAHFWFFGTFGNSVWALISFLALMLGGDAILIARTRLGTTRFWAVFLSLAGIAAAWALTH